MGEAVTTPAGRFAGASASGRTTAPPPATDHVLEITYAPGVGPGADRDVRARRRGGAARSSGRCSRSYRVGGREHARGRDRDRRVRHGRRRRAVDPSAARGRHRGAARRAHRGAARSRCATPTKERVVDVDRAAPDRPRRGPARRSADRGRRRAHRRRRAARSRSCAARSRPASTSSPRTRRCSPRAATRSSAAAARRACDVYYEARGLRRRADHPRAARGARGRPRSTRSTASSTARTTSSSPRWPRRARRFEDALAEAQRLGYAEADPTLDVAGGDAAQKLCVLAQLAFGARLAPQDVLTEGIRRSPPRTSAGASEFGYALKLLAIAGAPPRRRTADQIEARVHPAFIPAGSLLAGVRGAMNAVRAQSEALGPVDALRPGRGRDADGERGGRRTSSTSPATSSPAAPAASRSRRASRSSRCGRTTRSAAPTTCTSRCRTPPACSRASRRSSPTGASRSPRSSSASRTTGQAGAARHRHAQRARGGPPRRDRRDRP